MTAKIGKLMILLVFLTGTFLFGCEKTVEGIKEDASDALEKTEGAEEAMKKLGDAAGDAVKAAEDAAEDMKKDAKNKFEEASGAAADKVKEAFNEATKKVEDATG